jgi:predicted Zn-dependent protease
MVYPLPDPWIHPQLSRPDGRGETPAGDRHCTGRHQATAYYNLAFAIITSYPEDVDEAQAAIRETLALSPKDPFVQSLAGKIAHRGKNYPAAVVHLRRALEL